MAIVRHVKVGLENLTGIWLAGRENLERAVKSSLPNLDRAERIGEFWGHPETRKFGDLLIDLEEEPAARAVIYWLLREVERK